MMLFWMVILVTVPFSYGQIRETEYECGAHGRFEYCIDGIPGCVIGCHCHPGYYFDTDTKICEPNIRLTQNFRRNYEIAEPTRIYIHPTPSTVEKSTTTARDAVDEKIDIITQDADDLGDWLYNQFFKTIENQVINETKNETMPSRRSDSSPTFLNKPTRRSHKYRRSKKKKKKKRKGMKSKLLRITEDDSLFDSSSSSSSDYSSDTTSSSSSETSEEHHREKRVEHGRKLIVYNKRPKPPLPSFIFLPNMETPFFPPIGLPAPPVPMYPMVPVPPVMGPPYTYPAGATPCQNGGESTTSASVTSTSKAVSTSKHTTVSHTTTTASNIADENNEQEGNPQEENPQEENPQGENTETNVENAAKESQQRLRSLKKPRRGHRNKLMQKLRDKFKRKNKLQNFLANEYLGPEAPVDVDAYQANQIKAFSEMNEKGELLPGLQDIGFKYLTQLIHRANLNTTSQITTPPPILRPTEHIKNVTLPPVQSRKYYYNSNPNEIAQQLSNLANQQVNQILHPPGHDLPIQYLPNVPHRKKIEDTNDMYYANLGRQIAAMIRNTDGDKDVDIEISGSSHPSDPIFNGNSGSRSYWERSVRSPFKNLSSYKKEMNILKQSNENLFSLENKAQLAALTAPTLSLKELENIISKVERAKSKLINKHGSSKHGTESSKRSFNVNLLVGNDQPLHSDGILKKTKKIPIKTRLDNHKTKSRNDSAKLSNTDPKNLLLADFLFSLRKTVQSKNNLTQQNLIPIIQPIKKPNTIVKRFYNLPRNYFSSYIYNAPPLQRKLPLPINTKLPIKQPTTSEPHNYQLSRTGPNRTNSNNYYTRNNNQYLLREASVPMNFPTLSRHINSMTIIGRPQQSYLPSYFDKINHFDYFDDRSPNGWFS